VSRSVFLDASAWFAVQSPRDARHVVATNLYANARRAGVTFVSTSLVVAEVHGLLLRSHRPSVGRDYLEAVLASTAVTILAADVDLLQVAIVDWIGRYADQPFSLCDAVSFAVMQRERVTHAFAFDRHFEVAGFQLLR
jgi:predicted nucleic acid-binding protein